MTPLLASRGIKTVVLVADIYDEDASNLASDRRRDLEKSTPETVASVMQAIESLGLPVLHLQTLDELSARASERQYGDLVLSIFGGERSRNRMALVPAICESFNMRYIGPDVYGRIVCQDKEISKQLALQCGVRTPPYRLVRAEQDLERFVPKQFPMVVKPSLEGSSIGISQRCVVHSLTQLHEVTRSILAEFEQPVLLEEFARGREVCFNVIETDGLPHTNLVEIRMVDQPNYFHDHLFTADIKAPWEKLEIVTLADALDDVDCQSLHRLIAAFGGVGYCRIDGKLLDGHFHFLEVTPDAWLDPQGAFALSFTQTGWSYSEVLAKVLASEPEGRRHPRSSD